MPFGQWHLLGQSQQPSGGQVPSSTDTFLQQPAKAKVIAINPIINIAFI
jgi:hypothetical protein